MKHLITTTQGLPLEIDPWVILNNALYIDKAWALQLLNSLRDTTTMDSTIYNEYKLYIDNYNCKPQPNQPYKNWWEESF